MKADPRAGVGLGWDEGKLRPQGWSPPLVVRLAPESQICVPHCFREACGGSWGLGFMGLPPPESRGAGMGEGVVCGGRGCPSSRAPDLAEAACSSLGAVLSAGPRLGKAVPGLAPSKRSWFSSLAGVHGVACHDWEASRTPCRPSHHTQARREEEAETQAGTQLLAGWSSGSVLTFQSLSPSPARWRPQPGASRSITGWWEQRPGLGPTGQVSGGRALVAPWLPAPAGPGAATFCFVSREPD